MQHLFMVGWSVTVAAAMTLAKFHKSKASSPAVNASTAAVPGVSSEAKKSQ